MANVRYTKPGRDFAVCNKSDGSGHYVKVFEFPDLDKIREDESPYIQTPVGVDACWWFMNRLDFGAWVEAVYPVEIFESPLLREAKL